MEYQNLGPDEQQTNNNNNPQNGLNPSSHSNLSSGVNASLNLVDVSRGPMTLPEIGSY